MHSTTELLRQSRQYSLKLRLPTFSSEQSRHAWQEALLDPDEPADALAGLDAITSNPGQCLFLEFMLKLARTLLQQGRVAVFTDIRPIRLQTDDAQNQVYLLTLQLPHIDFIPQAAIRIALEAAARIAAWVAGTPPSQSNQERVFAAITTQVLPPLHAQVPGGKSTIPLLRAAHRLDIPFLHLGTGIYQLGWGSKAKRLDRSAGGQDSYSGVKLSQNKVLTANLLRMAGLPAPQHDVVGSEQDAVSAAQRLGFPLVVKPIQLDRGEGVSVDISDEATLLAAFRHACRVAKRSDALVERQVRGVCHRLFIADGRLLYAVKRMPMAITADGNHSIAELVAGEVQRQQQRAPWLRTEIQPLDQVAHEVLAALGYTPASIPPEGTVVPLRRIESTADGGIDIDVTSVLHPDNEALAIDAARLVGLQMAGIDIISADISEPWYLNDAIISEVNFSPLLGGGDISRAAIPRFLSRFLNGDGRIPVISFAGRAEALAQQAQWLAQGLRSYSTGADWTIDPLGRPMVMPFNDAARRVQALLYRSDVDAIACST